MYLITIVPAKNDSIRIALNGRLLGIMKKDAVKTYLKGLKDGIFFFDNNPTIQVIEREGVSNEIIIM